MRTLRKTWSHSCCGLLQHQTATIPHLLTNLLFPVTSPSPPRRFLSALSAESAGLPIHVSLVRFTPRCPRRPMRSRSGIPVALVLRPRWPVCCVCPWGWGPVWSYSCFFCFSSCRVCSPSRSPSPLTGKWQCVTASRIAPLSARKVPASCSAPLHNHSPYLYRPKKQNGRKRVIPWRVPRTLRLICTPRWCWSLWTRGGS